MWSATVCIVGWRKNLSRNWIHTRSMLTHLAILGNSRCAAVDHAVFAENWPTDQCPRLICLNAVTWRCPVSRVVSRASPSDTLSLPLSCHADDVSTHTPCRPEDSPRLLSSHLSTFYASAIPPSHYTSYQASSGNYAKPSEECNQCRAPWKGKEGKKPGKSVSDKWKRTIVAASNMWKRDICGRAESCFWLTEFKSPSRDIIFHVYTK